MADDYSSVYQVWSADGVVYGPIDQPTLESWAKQGRLAAETWVYHTLYDRWQKAEQLPELQIHFRSAPAKSAAEPASAQPLEAELEPAPPARDSLKPKAIRKIKVFGNFEDAEIQTFLNYIDIILVKQWEMVVKQGDPGDGMFLVLDGEVRVRMIIMSKETVITKLSAGDFFGEVSLFDHGPRSADVVANRDSLLLKLTAASFLKLIKEQPQLAAPFLQSICKTLTSRIRADNKRFRESIKMIRSASHYNNL